MEAKEEVVESKINSSVGEQEELITDFSQMFKKDTPFRNPPKLSTKQIEQTPNWLLEIPSKLEITIEDVLERKYFDQRRWQSMVQCVNQKERIIASALSAWNYLYSKKGVGNLQALTIKTGTAILGSKNIKYQADNQFQRANILINCFEALSSEFKLNNESKVIIKPAQPHKIQISQSEYLNSFLQGLKRDDKYYILITYSNILCSVGFQKTPLIPIEAFKRLSDIKEQNLELWIMNCSTLRFEPSFMIKRWRDVKKNLQTVWPNYTDLQQAKKGVMRHPAATEENQKEDRGNSHCIIEFTRL